VTNEADFDLKYQLTESEFCKAHRNHLQRSLFSIKNLVLLTTALGIGAIQAAMFGGTDWALRIFAGLWVLVVAFAAWAFTQLPARIYRNSQRHSGQQRLQTEEHGITVEQGGEKAFLEWKDIAGVTEAEGAVLLRRTHGVPIFIPERAFATAEERASFRERVERARIR
jgi:hypothetical protein